MNMKVIKKAIEKYSKELNLDKLSKNDQFIYACTDVEINKIKEFLRRRRYLHKI